jgi:hypothetical protein
LLQDQTNFVKVTLWTKGGGKQDKCVCVYVWYRERWGYLNGKEWIYILPKTIQLIKLFIIIG